MSQPSVIVGIYPDVPAFRGVPQLRRSPSAGVLRAISIVTAAIHGRLWQSAASQPKWGIFGPDGKAAIVADSILAFENRNEFRVSDFPVQRGSFASYNKVATPFENSVRLSKAGDVTARANFLKSIDNAAQSLGLFSILTPERTYLDVNIIRYEVSRRGSGGAYFLTEVDVFFREIRQVAAQYSTSAAATRNAQQPSARPSVSQGIVQPAPEPALSDDGF